MTKHLTTFAVLIAALILAPVVASADNLSYDDPAVHFSAPDGWTRMDVPQGENAPVAAFRKDNGHYDTRVIMLKIEQYRGSLDGLKGTHESDLRSQSQDVFVEKRTQVTLSNGMPAWQIKYTTGSEGGSSVRTVEDIVYDGRRSIILSYIGRAGTYDDKEAVAALATLTVVLYPQGR